VQKVQNGTVCHEAWMNLPPTIDAALIR